MPRNKKGGNLHDRKYKKAKQAERVARSNVSLCPSAIASLPARNRVHNLADIAAKGNARYTSYYRNRNDAASKQGDGTAAPSETREVISKPLVLFDDNKNIEVYYEPRALSIQSLKKLVPMSQTFYRNGKGGVTRGRRFARPGQKMMLGGYACSRNWFTRLPHRVKSDKVEGMKDLGEEFAKVCTQDFLAKIGSATQLYPELPDTAAGLFSIGGRATTLAMTRNFESYGHCDRDGGGSSGICWMLSGPGQRPAGGNFVLPELGLEFQTRHGAAIFFDSAKMRHFTQSPVPVKGGPDLMGIGLYQNKAVLDNAAAIGATRVKTFAKVLELVQRWVMQGKKADKWAPIVIPRDADSDSDVYTSGMSDSDSDSEEEVKQPAKKKARK